MKRIRGALIGPEAGLPQENSGGGRQGLLLPPGGGRNAEDALEGAIEGGFRFVARVEGHAGHGIARVGETAGGKLHPPAQQIAHGRVAHEIGKAGGESGTGEANLRGKVFRCPLAVETAMEKSDGAADGGIAKGGKPAPLPFR